MISILCPTRNRPRAVRRTVASASQTAAGPLEFVFYTDDDTTGSVPPDVEHMPNVRVLTGPRLVMTDLWNPCWHAAAGPVFMQADDETMFETPGWDQAVLAAFDDWPDRIGLVYGWDGIQPDTFGTHGFLHHRWTDALGYFTPPHFSCDHGDTWLNDLAAMIGRKRHIPIMTRHLHPNVGWGPWDQTHQDRLERSQRDQPNELYARLLPDRLRDAERLRAAMTCG